MRKILVVGSGGAGKSTLAHTLGERLSLEVLHLDKYYWRPGWVETPKPEWLKVVEELLARDAWVMDGNYSGTLDLRLRACDTVIFLDLPRTLCVWRVLKRAVTYWGKRRPDMGEGCPEKLSLEFLLWVWNYPRTTKPKIVAMIEANAERKKVVWLRSQADVNRFLEEQGAATPLHGRSTH